MRRPRSQITARSRANRMERGYCVYCQQPRLQGLTTCGPHRASASERAKRRYELHKTLRLCVNCLEPRGAFTRCDPCRRERAGYLRAWRRRVREAAP